jgi:hypothetical protein
VSDRLCSSFQSVTEAPAIATRRGKLNASRSPLPESADGNCCAGASFRGERPPRPAMRRGVWRKSAGAYTFLTS